MNTQTDQNNSTQDQAQPIQTDAPAPEVDDDEDLSDAIAQEQDETERMAEELKSSSYDELVHKYGLQRLFEKTVGQMPITYNYALGNIALDKHLFILDFVPPNDIMNIPKRDKDAIIALIASLKPENTAIEVNNWLKEINPTYKVPEGFKVKNFQPNALGIYNANYNLQNIICDNLAPEYLIETMHFLHLPKEKLDNISSSLEGLTQKIQKEYDKMMKNQQPSDLVINEAIDFLGKCGRTQLFLQNLRERKNLGDITEVIIRISTSLQIALKIKSKNLPEDISEEEVLGQIKEHLMKDLYI